MRQPLLFSFVTLITVLFLFSFSKIDSKNIAVKDNLEGNIYSLEDYKNDNSSLFSFDDFVAKASYLVADASDNIMLLVDSKADNKSTDKTSTAKKPSAKDNKTADNGSFTDPLARAIQDNATKVYEGFKNLFSNGFDNASEKDNGSISDAELFNSLINSISDGASKIYNEFNQLIAKDNKSDNKTAADNKSTVDNKTAADNITK